MNIEVELLVNGAVAANDGVLVSSEVSGYGYARSSANASGSKARMVEKEEAKLSLKAGHKPTYERWTITIMYPSGGLTIPLSGQETNKSDSARNLLSLGGGYSFSDDGAQIHASQYASAKATQSKGDFGRSAVDANVVDLRFE